ncbi:MAG TPA: hypothetical protein DET40_14445 [Lentisphaeria bacterium]|nr:MAG: hypothetical protein A2X45_05620 [Lentisphaerae bacterium GWF2_50_93]HCE44738.1 hypothetical protein [Lentisphaeria bacterium]
MNLNGPCYVESQHFYSGIDYFMKTLAFAARNDIPFDQAIDGFCREGNNEKQIDDLNYKVGKSSYFLFLPIFLLVLFFMFKILISLMSHSVYMEDIIKWTMILLAVAIILPVLMFVMGKKKLKSFIVVKPPSFNSQLMLVSADLKNGVSLSESFVRRLHRYFPDYLLLAIQKADKEKKLKEILPQLAENICFVHGLKNEIKASFAYPVIQFVNLSLIATGLMVFIVPKFQRIMAELYEGNTVYYPEMTKIVFYVSDFLHTHYDTILSLFFVGLCVGLLISNLPLIKRILEECLIRVPVFGWYYKAAAQVELSGSMAAFISSGDDVIKAAEWSIVSSRYQFIRFRLGKFVKSAENGRNWLDAWEDMNLYDPLHNMIIRNAVMRDKLSEGFDTSLRWVRFEISSSAKGFLQIIEIAGILINVVLFGSIIIGLALGIFRITDYVTVYW